MVTVHRNLSPRFDNWSVGSPVEHYNHLIARGVTFPTTKQLMNRKQFRDCIHGVGSRKVFARAKCESVNLSRAVQTPVANLKARNYQALSRIYFNPKERGDTFFYTIENGEKTPLFYAHRVVFGEDGNAYVWRYPHNCPVWMSEGGAE